MRLIYKNNRKLFFWLSLVMFACFIVFYWPNNKSSVVALEIEKQLYESCSDGATAKHIATLPPGTNCTILEIHEVKPFIYTNVSCEVNKQIISGCFTGGVIKPRVKSIAINR